MINFNVPPFTGKEMEYIKECVDNQKICGDGKYTKKCNEWLEKRTGVTKALLTTSCTHATEMAALLAGIKEGDEVIMPSYTFVSTADAFVLRGAKAVFVDINSRGVREFFEVFLYIKHLYHTSQPRFLRSSS